MVVKAHLALPAAENSLDPGGQQVTAATLAAEYPSGGTASPDALDLFGGYIYILRSISLFFSRKLTKKIIQHQVRIKR